MKKLDLFVVDGKLCTRENGKVVEIQKIRRFTPKGEEKSFLAPYIVDRYVVLVELVPVSVSFIYKDGRVKELMVPRGYEYWPVTAPLSSERKRPP